MSLITQTDPSEDHSIASLEHRDMIVADIHDHAHDALFQASTDDVVKIRQGDIVIAILGPSGSGKSEFINTVAGLQLAPTTAGLNSCTEEVRAYKCKHPVDDRYVILVDTPGFDNSHQLDVTVLDGVTKWMLETYQDHILLSGVLQLHNISEKRMRSPQVMGLEMLSELCGPYAKSNLIMLTTFCDLVDDTVVAAREAELVKKFWRLNFLTEGPLVGRLQPRTQACAWNVVDLFETGAHLVPKPLRIQTEMGDKHRQFYETSVWKYLLAYWTSIIHHVLPVEQSLLPSSSEERARKQREKLVGAIPKNRQAEFGLNRLPFVLKLPFSRGRRGKFVRRSRSGRLLAISGPGTSTTNSTSPFLVGGLSHVAAAPSQVSVIPLSNTSSSGSTYYYSAYDGDAEDSRTLTESMLSTSAPFAESDSVIDSLDEDNYNLLAEQLARSSIISMTSSNSSATTEYGSIYWARELLSSVEFAL